MLDVTMKQLARHFNAAQLAALHKYLAKLADTLQGAYVYCLADGTPEFIVIRFGDGQSKTFRQCHFVGDELIFKRPQHGRRYALYGGQLLDKHPKATVIACEGEKATLALNRYLHQAGILGEYVAVTSGGARSARTADWDGTCAHPVLIWADNDEAGIGYAQDVSDQTKGIARSRRFIDIQALNLPESGDAADWVAQQTEINADAIRALPVIDTCPQLVSGTSATSVMSAGNDAAPLPLFREIEGELSYPVAALGPLLAGATRSISDALQCPVELAANSVLSAASLLVQGQVDVCVDGRRTPVSLYLMTVANSGERKTTADKLAMAPIYAFEKRAYTQYKQALKAHKAMLKTLEKGEVPPDEPVDPTLIQQDVTLDALIRGLIHGCPSQALVLSEAGSFLGGYAMAKELMLRTAAFMAAAWSGESISQSRVTGRHTAHSRRLSAHLQGQPEVMTTFVENELLQNQGLLPRFLMSWPKSAIGTRSYRQKNLRTDAAYQAYTARLNVLLAQSLPLDEDNELDPRELVLSDEAYALWVDAHDAIERESGPGGALASMQGTAAKLAEQILRLAAVTTVFEQPNALEIGEGAMDGAIRLANYYLHEAKRLTLGQGNRMLKQAKELLDWLRGQPDPIALRDIYRNGPRFVRNAKQAREYLDILIEHGWAQSVDGYMTAADGKVSRENYTVCRDV